MESLPSYLQERVLISNKIVKIVLAITVFYSITTFFFANELTWIPLLEATFLLISIFLLKKGFLNIARFTIISSLTLSLAVFHAYLLKPNEMLYASFTAIQISLVGFVWVLFDSREHEYIWPTSLWSVICVLFPIYINHFFEIDFNTEVFKSGPLALTGYIIGPSTLIFGMYLIQSINLKSEIKLKEILKKMDESNIELHTNETKLNNLLKEYEKQIEEERKNQWITNGIARFADIIKDNLSKSESEFYTNILTNLVKITESNQAGIFTTEQDNLETEFLSLKSCYAYERVKHEKTRIEIGEGLLGQVFLEGKTSIFNKVPQLYTKITSGIGEITPGFLLFVPLIAGDKVLGVIEFASFKPMPNHYIVFLEKVSENIANTIAALKLTQKMKELLEISQKQTQEMKNQEEEMLQNLEELSATQEEMIKKEDKLKEIIKMGEIKEQELILENEKLMQNLDNKNRVIIELEKNLKIK